MKKLIVTTAFIFLTTASTFAAECGTYHKITEPEIRAAQQAWGDGLVNIGSAEDHKKAAIDYIDELYGYDIGRVLFKPTKASIVEFRNSRDEALSYFIGGIEPEDHGFALTPFTKVRFDNKGFIIDCDSAMAMGNYYFTKTNAEEIKVDYSFGYIKDKNGHLKINLHHSSLPYKPDQ